VFQLWLGSEGFPLCSYEEGEEAMSKWTLDGLRQAIIDIEFDRWCEDMPDDLELTADQMHNKKRELGHRRDTSSRLSVIDAALHIGIIENLTEVEE
jgi:hypothetical protein